MHTSSIELEGEELIKITKQVIKPNSVQCLWNTSAGQNGKATKCQVQLVCWEAYHRVWNYILGILYSIYNEFTLFLLAIGPLELLLMLCSIF